MDRVIVRSRRSCRQLETHGSATRRGKAKPTPSTSATCRRRWHHDCRVLRRAPPPLRTRPVRGPRCRGGTETVGPPRLGALASQQACGSAGGLSARHRPRRCRRPGASFWGGERSGRASASRAIGRAWPARRDARATPSGCDTRRHRPIRAPSRTREHKCRSPVMRSRRRRRRALLCALGSASRDVRYPSIRRARGAALRQSQQRRGPAGWDRRTEQRGQTGNARAGRPIHSCRSARSIARCSSKAATSARRCFNSRSTRASSAFARRCRWSRSL